MRKIVLDLDDFSILRSRLDLLLRLKDHYPSLKLSLFTIPFDYEYEMTDLRLQRDQALKIIHNNLDWMQIIPHGLLHIPKEFENADKKGTETALKAIDEAFRKDGLPYVKGFKAPYWLWNKDVVDVLNEYGWFGAVDPDQPEMLKPKRFYRHRYSIAKPFWEEDDKVLKIHGHMTPPSPNNIDDCFLNLMKIPRESEFYFVTDFLDEIH